MNAARGLLVGNHEFEDIVKRAALDEEAAKLAFEHLVAHMETKRSGNIAQRERLNLSNKNGWRIS